MQQEVRLTVKLFYALNLTDGNLDDPKVEGLVVRKLGQDGNYVAGIPVLQQKLRGARVAVPPPPG